MSWAFQLYSARIESGLPWLGEMPAHWKLAKTKHLFHRVQRPVREQDDVVTAFRDGQVTLRSKRRTDGFTNAEKEIGYQGVRVGDLLVHAMDGFAGAVGVSDSEGKCSPVCSVCVPRRPGEIYMRYYGYLVRQLAVTDFISSLAKGIRERSTEFRYSEFSVLPLPLPPHSEQVQIARFLDYETARIDALIEKQQQLIALLKEKSQAVINHAVTKGMNPNAPLRDSGVKWLGMVPRHWQVARLKFLVSHVVDCHHSTPAYDTDAPWPALRTSDVYPGRLDIEGAKRVRTAEYRQRISRLKPEAGDVVYSREGGRWGVAAPIPVGVDVCLAQRVMLCRGNEKMSSQLLMWALNAESAYHQLAVNVVGSASPHVNVEDVMEVWLAVPPRGEQDELAASLEKRLVRLVSLDAQCVGLVERLQERRTALISAAVTGKIDVRGWAPPESKMEQDVA